jgi:hypothetical protein
MNHYQHTTAAVDTGIIADLVIFNITSNDIELVAGGWTRLILTNEPVASPPESYWSRYKHSHIRLQTTITTTQTVFASDFVELAEIRDALTEFVHNNTTACYSCEDRLWPDDDQHDDENGNTICDDCRDSHYSTCDDCSDLVHYDDLVTDESGDVSLCGSCYRSGYSTCSNCGRITPDGEMSGDDGECQTCYDDRQPEELDYPQPRRHQMFLATHRDGQAIPSDLPPIGVEIEFYADSDTEEANSNVQNFFDQFNARINKSLLAETPDLRLDPRKSWLTSDKDGSLYDHSHGIEIMTLPLRLETWREILDDRELSQAYNYMMHRTSRKTGLHISIPAQIDGVSKVKVMYVFNALCRYLDKDSDEAYAWIGRTPSSYSNNRPLDNTSIKDQCQKRYGSKCGAMTLRSQPQPDSQTIGERLGRLEFRAPRTPDTFEGLKKRINKFATMLRFCKTDTAGLYAMTDQEIFQALQAYELSLINDKAKA